jgi:uncharacterized protein YkwD
VSRRSHHDDPACDGLVIVVDDTHQCSRCGARIRAGSTCRECGGPLTVTDRTTPVDLSPTISRRALERAIHDATNHARARHDLDALDADLHLATIARSHSCHMVDADFSGHDTPDGTTIADRYDRTSYDWRRCGENVAKHYPDGLDDATTIARDVVDGWLDSPGHRENLLDDDWRVEGIGVDYATDGAVLATQNFA